MFQPSLLDKTLDEMLVYLKDIAKGEQVIYTDFVDYFMPKNKDTYILVEILQKNKHINYYPSLHPNPIIQITSIGNDFISNGGYTEINKTKFDNDQLIKDTHKISKRNTNWVIAGTIVALLALLLSIYTNCHQNITK